MRIISFIFLAFLLFVVIYVLFYVSNVVLLRDLALYVVVSLFCLVKYPLCIAFNQMIQINKDHVYTMNHVGDINKGWGGIIVDFIWLLENRSYYNYDNQIIFVLFFIHFSSRFQIFCQILILNYRKYLFWTAAVICGTTYKRTPSFPC